MNRFKVAAAAATPKVSFRLASTRVSVATLQKPSQPCSHGRATKAASGISTISDR